MPRKRKHTNPNPASKHIWRSATGHEYPLEDLEHKAQILIQPTKPDVKCGIPRDENNCALSQAWKRQADVPDAMIGVSIAYLPMRRRGKMVAVRCEVRAETRRAIDHFDRTGELPDEGFLFYGIRPSNKIESQRAQQKQHRTRWNNKKNVTGKKIKRVYLRNASRRAQVVIE